MDILILKTIAKNQPKQIPIIWKIFEYWNISQTPTKWYAENKEIYLNIKIIALNQI